MTTPTPEERAVENTDKEIWRGPDEGFGSFYADSIFVTKDGGIGINCGGNVRVMPVRMWHALACDNAQALRASFFDGRNEGIKEAAKVADKRAESEMEKWRAKEYHGVGCDPHFGARANEAERIASAIRNLKRE